MVLEEIEKRKKTGPKTATQPRPPKLKLSVTVMEEKRISEGALCWVRTMDKSKESGWTYRAKGNHCFGTTKNGHEKGKARGRGAKKLITKDLGQVAIY